MINHLGKSDGPLLILQADLYPVTRQAEFVAALGDSEGSVLLRLLDNGSRRFMTLRWR